MTDSDKKRLEEAEQYAKRSREHAEACGFNSSDDADRVFFLISHLKDATAVLSRVRELHSGDNKHGILPPYCVTCLDDWPCSTIRILDGEVGASLRSGPAGQGDATC